jgi:heat shock protein HslJ
MEGVKQSVLIFIACHWCHAVSATEIYEVGSAVISIGDLQGRWDYADQTDLGRFSLQIEGEKYFMNPGCNELNGRFRIVGNEFRTRCSILTDMWCDDANGQRSTVDEQVMNFISLWPNIKLNETSLTLEIGSLELNFVRSAEIAQHEL